MRILRILVLLVCLTLGLSSCAHAESNVTINANTNTQIITTKDFYLDAASTSLSSYSRGTVFISGQNGKANQVVITAWVVVDPNDVGGATISLPSDWIVSSLVSSYPAKYVHLWLMSPSLVDRIDKQVIIGQGKGSYPTGGGQGNIIITTKLARGVKAAIDPFDMYVALGSKVLDNGIQEVNTDGIDVEVPLC